DIFGKVKPEQKRLREMIKATQQLPQPCRENRLSTASNQFLKWQADVVSFREVNRTEELPGLLWKKELSPKLRSDITHLAFSNDGKYFLAQDDFAITVLQREPLQVVFQIPAPEAKKSSFTPDGQYVVFGTEGLRYEKWSIAERKPVEVRELVIRRDCWEHEFSPDGKYLACVDYDTNLNVLDTQTGKRVWEKKDFYRLTFFELLSWITAGSRNEGDAPRFFNIEYSPDSRFLAVSRSHRFRFRFRIDTMVVDESENTLLALDLGTLKPISIGGDLKKVTQRPFLFLDSGRILGMSNRKLSDGGIFSFPEGKRLAKFDLGAEEMKGTANPNYVILKPLANAKMGILDLSRNSIVSGLNKNDATMWNELIVFEGTSGKVFISEAHYNEEKKMMERKELGAIEIPVSSVAQLSAAEVSDNFQWLAISSKTRGALWNLTSGERKIFVRGFRGALLSNDGGGIGDFPRLDPVNHALVVMNANNNTVNMLREIPDKGARQHGRFVLIRESLKQKKNEKDKSDDKQGSYQPDDESETSLAREVRMELRDILTDKVVWSREYPKEAPDLFFDEFSGRLIFYWTLGSDAGKARLKEDPALEARSKAMGNKDDDYLIEVFDAFAGKTKGTLLVETGKGSFDIESGYSEGNWLVLHDSHNRILAFSITDGELRHRFFGAHAAINPATSQVVVENNPGELTLYDLTSGDRQGKLVFRSAAAFVRFSLDGKKLFVLSDDQIAHVFDLEKLQTRATTAMQ
ncbi:MAG TPA: WD40 repeat domain-containing protein, partial [Pyrinomonadaceae bacterium]|nr:WD40 repeat domain-containing protein [Pyrinomonadaceae bacterium]